MTRFITLPLVILCVYAQFSQARAATAPIDPFELLPGDEQPVQCSTFVSRWTGGTPPFQLSITSRPSVGITLSIGPISGQDVPWKTPYRAGVTVLLSVSDSTGVVVHNTDELVIQPSSDDSCVSQGHPSSTSLTSIRSSTSLVPSSFNITTTSSIAVSITRHALETSFIVATSRTLSSSSKSTITSPSHITSISVTASASQSQLLSTSITTTPSSTTTFTSVHTTSTTPSESLGASANSDHSRSVPLRTIVGISIGGAAVLILAMLSLCYAVRRMGRRRRPLPQENGVSPRVASMRTRAFSHSCR